MKIVVAKPAVFVLICFLVFGLGAELPANDTIIYLIPGQGADERSFDRLELPGYELVDLPILVPEFGESMREYAGRMSRYIDVSRPIVLVGVSFGGMVAVEMAELVETEAVIIISSAKTRNELPLRYRILKYLPIHRIVGPDFYTLGAKLARPVFEPASRDDSDLFQSMVETKQKEFIKRAMHCIVTWNRRTVPDGIHHIHGNADHTLPLGRIDNAVVVDGGSHMMVYLRADEISKIIRNILEENLK